MILRKEPGGASYFGCPGRFFVLCLDWMFRGMIDRSPSLWGTWVGGCFVLPLWLFGLGCFGSPCDVRRFLVVFPAFCSDSLLQWCLPHGSDGASVAGFSLLSPWDRQRVSSPSSASTALWVAFEGASSSWARLAV